MSGDPLAANNGVVFLPSDHPAQRANARPGHGTWDNDRPPIVGVIGRDRGQVHLLVCHHSDHPTWVPFVVTPTQPGCTVNTDEGESYNTLPDAGRIPVRICHAFRQGTWARDDDGDGLREVHTNSIEGYWTGWRNFLRLFRGINKIHLTSKPT